MESSCIHCGTPISYSGRGRPPVYCSRRCSELARTARRQQEIRASVGDRRCQMCDGPIPDRLDRRARFCSVKCNTAFHNRQQRARKREAMLANRAPCAQCGGAIPEDRRGGSIYCSAACKKRVNDEAWRLRSPHYMREYLYGLSQEQYEAMLAAQGGRCAICGSPDWPAPVRSGSPHVDHDGKCDQGHPPKRACARCVRGLLCGHCNAGIGQFDHDPARLRAAAEYLEASAS